MKIAITGASGLIGGALTKALRAQGHDVRRLVRRGAVADDEVTWNPADGSIDLRPLAGTNAFINLAGENLAGGRWTEAQKEKIMRSRTDATRTVVAAMGQLEPAPTVLINASAVGFYGDRGEEILSEASTMGRGFLPEVVWAWETHADGAKRFGARVVKLRFGVVLGRGGALARMLPIFRLGLGGPMGSGKQWMSWVALDDVVGVAAEALTRHELEGPINVVAPNPVTNRDFARELGRVLRRPAVLPAPAFALRVLFGRAMADEALLASTRAVSEVLRKTGYVYRRPELADALRAAV